LRITGDAKRHLVAARYSCVGLTERCSRGSRGEINRTVRSPATGRSKGRPPGVTADPNDDVLNGVRVLVVEDEAAISMLLEDMLLDFGCAVVGPAARLSSALEMASQESFEVAILDVNVAGEPIYPVAEAIAKRDLPLVFSTGYGGAGIREPFRDRPVVQKPFSQADLKRTLIGAIRAARD
jgi:CheY-like chemotaxis protein